MSFNQYSFNSFLKPYLVVLILLGLFFIMGDVFDEKISSIEMKKIVNSTLDENTTYTVLSKEELPIRYLFSTVMKLSVIVEKEQTGERYHIELENKSSNANEIYKTFSTLIVGDDFTYEGDGNINLAE